ncbi:DUF6362 family protein [Bradyrhizobium oligotrophicum]|uniref:DUF6362 family protein n=1 Tax=Bradyrhizobium oligotrophicum TaxID=44255 RepID=UPI003EBF1674
MTPQQQHSALKAAIKRSIVIMDAMADKEARFQKIGQVWSRATSDATLAYGYNETRVRIVPTAREIGQAETVGEWLAWLGHNHGGVPLLVSWAHDTPVWRLAEREHCSERTIHNRIDRSVALILKEFGDVDPQIEDVEEGPKRAHLPNFMTERAVATDMPAVSQHGKCWIDGVGFMLKGKRLRTGCEKIERLIYAY